MSLQTVITKRTEHPESLNLFQKIDNALDRIRTRAYEFCQLRGSLPDHELDDWFQAEAELFEVPGTELAETATGYEMKLVVPGFKPENLNVALDGGYITIQGDAERRQETHGKMLVSEISRKEMFRRFALPQAVNEEAIRAEMTDGVLTITIPKITTALTAPAQRELQKAEQAPEKVDPVRAEAKKAKAAHAAA